MISLFIAFGCGQGKCIYEDNNETKKLEMARLSNAKDYRKRLKKSSVRNDKSTLETVALLFLTDDFLLTYSDNL